MSRIAVRAQGEAGEAGEGEPGWMGEALAAALVDTPADWLRYVLPSLIGRAAAARQWAGALLPEGGPFEAPGGPEGGTAGDADAGAADAGRAQAGDQDEDRAASGGQASSSQAGAGEREVVCGCREPVVHVCE